MVAKRTQGKKEDAASVLLHYLTFLNTSDPLISPKRAQISLELSQQYFSYILTT